MKKLLIAVIVAGAFVAIGIGAHALLVNAAGGDGTLSQRAAETCAVCHGG